MKKITLFNIIIFLGLFFVFVPISHAEVIKDFNSTVNVFPDSSIVVTEKITYDFETSIRRGIIRDIRTLNSKNEPMQVKVLSVYDGNDNPYNFTTDKEGNILTIKIGDSNKMVSGIKEYNISYQVLGSITYYGDFDEIYWNVTGSDWQVPIEKSEARVLLPNNVFPTNQACYYGVVGSKANCTISESGEFSLGKRLENGEGLTVAVGFPKGIVVEYKTKTDSALVRNIKIFWPLIIPIITFIWMLTKWLKVGRDPKGKGVIVAEYDVPDNLTPLEVGGIVNEQVKNQNISAEIIYLATKGYLKIKQTEERMLGLIPKKDYEFTLLKEEGLLVNDFDKKILTTIFEDKGNVGGVAKLSELKNGFYKSIKDIDNSVIDTLLNKKYYTNFPKPKLHLSFVFLIVLFWLTLGFIGDAGFFGNNSLRLIFITVFCGSIFLSSIILLIFYRIMPAKSVKGVSTKEYLLGLKEYLQIAEKDRLNFHNAPDKNPEIFEALLPYAMIFGVEELWAKEFKDIYNTTPPSWYDGGHSKFNVVTFGHEIMLFNAIATSSLSSSPGSSGSGGGGFSGGGGGGGGGGSW